MKITKIDMPKFSILEKATYVDRNLRELDDGCGVYEEKKVTHVYRVLEFENEEEAIKEFHTIFEYETSKKRLKYGDFSKKEITLNDESIIKIIEIKQK